MYAESAGPFDNARTESPEMRGGLRSLAVHSLVVALLSPWILLISERTRKILLAVIILDIPIQFGTHIFYRESNAAMGALGGLNLSATTIALTALCLSCLVRVLSRTNTEARAQLHVNWSLLLYFAAMIVSVAVAQDTALAFFEVFLLGQSCLIYFYIANSLHKRRDVVFVVSMLLVGCLLESVIFIAMKVLVTPATSWDGPIHIYADLSPLTGAMRIGGTVGSPNTAGAYFSLVLAIAAGLLLTKLGFFHKLLSGAALILGTVALIFTFSRGGWIALASATSLLCLFFWRQRGLSWRVPLAVIVVLAIVYLPFHNAISARMFGDDKGSAESRIPLNMLAFRMIEDHPILGIGANNFTVAMRHYLTSEFRREFLYTVHNTYLLIWTETGIIGLLAYLAFLLGTLRKGWRCWKLGDPLLSPLALAFMAGIAGHMLHQGVDIFTDRPVQQLLWLLAGLLAAMSRICQQDGEPASGSQLS